MTQLPPQIDQFLRKVDALIAKYPHITQYELLKNLESKTGQPKALFFLAACVLMFGFVTLLGGIKLIVDLVGFVYPAYMSFKSIDSSQDPTQWLTYWVVFSAWNIMEGVFSYFIAWIPFYYYIKVCGIVYMYYPATHGATTIYHSVLRPFLLPHLEAGTSNGNSNTTTKKSE